MTCSTKVSPLISIARVFKLVSQSSYLKGGTVLFGEMRWTTPHHRLEEVKASQKKMTDKNILRGKATVVFVLYFYH